MSLFRKSVDVVLTLVLFGCGVAVAEGGKPPTTNPTKASPFQPKAQDLPGAAATQLPDPRVQDVKSQRWIQSSPNKKPTMPGSGPAKVTFKSTCTDSSGKTLNKGDADFETCMAEVHRLQAEKAARGGDKTSTKTSTKTGDPSAGAGFQIKSGN